MFAIAGHIYLFHLLSLTMFFPLKLENDHKCEPALLPFQGTSVNWQAFYVPTKRQFALGLVKTYMLFLDLTRAEV